MVLYLYPLIIGCFCSLMIGIGLRKSKKNIIIFFSILPCFFASPFFTVTRGAAGAVTASDFTGITLLVGLFFIPQNWKTPHGILPVKLITLWMIIMGVSIWTSGVYHNYWGVSGARLENLHMTNRLLLPVLIAGYRFFKLLTLYAYVAFFSILFFDAENIILLMRTIIVGCILLSVAKALTTYHIVDLSLAYGDMHSGYMGPRILGQTKACAGRLIFIGIILCFVKTHPKKIVGIIFIVILTAGLILTGSRGAIGALLVGLVPIFVMGRLKGLLIGGLGFIMIIITGLLVLHYDNVISQRLILSFSSESLSTASERVPIWSRTLSAWLDNPSIILFGVGAFNFAYAGLPIGYETAHNDILTIGLELGLISMMVFITWLFSMAWQLYKNTKLARHGVKWQNICIFAIFIGLLFAGQFEATFYPTIGTLPMVRIVFPLLIVIASYLKKGILVPDRGGGEI